MATWIKLDDTYYQNPKLLRVGDDGEILWIRGLCYCSNQLTDGRIPAEIVPFLARKPAAAATRIARKLVKAGLWYEDSDGFVVHDYQKHQRTNEQVELKRDEWARRKRRQRERPDVTQMSRRDPGGSHARVTPPETEVEKELEREEIIQNPRVTQEAVHSQAPQLTFSAETGPVCTCGHPIHHDEVFGWLHADFYVNGQNLDHRPAPAPDGGKNP